VDVGAHPVDGPPVYQHLLDSGRCRLVAFEPQQEGYEQLKSELSSPHLVYSTVLGDGTKQPFFRCRAPGMSSTLRPDPRWMELFPGFSEWSQIVAEHQVPTTRLDDIAETDSTDFLKIDVQGAESKILKYAQKALSHAVVVHTEVSFNPLYQGEGTFASLDQELRAAGFVFHTFAAINKRCFTPVMIDGDPHRGHNQFVQADAVYIRNITQLEKLTSIQIRKLCWLLHELYFSFDLVQWLLRQHDQTYDTRLHRSYAELIGLQVDQ